MNPPSQKKILIVAESIDVEDSSGSKANVALISNLKEAGFEVKVYHYSRKEIQLKGITCLAIKENRRSLLFYLSRIQRKIQHGFKINLAKYLEPRFGFSFTFLNDSKCIANSLNSATGLDPDLVISLSKGASYRPHHALLQVPRFHDRWLAYLHDPYPFHYYPEPYKWSEPGYLQKIRFFKLVSEKCNWAGYPSLLLAEWMEDHFQGFKGKRIIIPHQLHENISVENANLPKYFDSEKFSIVHAGSLLKQRDPFGLIKGFQQFLSEVPEAKKNAILLLLGNNSYHLKELQKIKFPQLYISRGYLPFNEVQLVQQEASVNVILEAKTDQSPFLPGKFPHCVEANKPILYFGPEKSEVIRLLGKEYNYWAEADDISLISLKIKELYLKWKADPNSLKLERQDLQRYLSADYLKKQIDTLI